MKRRLPNRKCLDCYPKAHYTLYEMYEEQFGEHAYAFPQYNITLSSSIRRRLDRVLLFSWLYCM